MLNLLREDWKQSTVLFYQCFDIWHLAVFFAGRGGGGGGVITGSDEDNGAETERVWWTMT